MGVLSIKEHQENALRHLQQTECAEFVDCDDGYVAGEDRIQANKCKYACGVPRFSSYGGDCCNRDSGEGDACEGFTGQVCKDKATGFPGSCSGNDACKNANIVSVFKSCTGKFALVLFYDMNSSVQYKVSTTWLFYLTLVCLY